MQQLMFPCPQCGKGMKVSMEMAGKSVRCPHCRQVITSPSTPSSPQPAEKVLPRVISPTITPREGTESIFGDPDDEDDSVFGAPAPAMKPIMPAAETKAPAPAPIAAKPVVATPKVIGSPKPAVPMPASPQAQSSVPAPQYVPTPLSNQVPSSAPAYVPAPLNDQAPFTFNPNANAPSPGSDENNPFATFEEPTATVVEKDEDEPEPSRRSARKPQSQESSGKPIWPWIVIALLAFYGLAMTVVAAIGWLRK